MGIRSKKLGGYTYEPDDHVAAIDRRDARIYRDIRINADFFPSIGTAHLFWKNVKECGIKKYCGGIYINYAGDAIDASVDGGLFWTLLFI